MILEGGRKRRRPWWLKADVLVLLAGVIGSWLIVLAVIVAAVVVL